MPCVPARDGLDVAQHVLHDLAEAERDDGEVVAAQAQRRRAEQQPGQRADHRREHDRAPEAEPERVDLGGEDGVGVDADRHERGDAQMQQAGEPGDDVETQAQDREQEDRPHLAPDLPGARQHRVDQRNQDGDGEEDDVGP